MDAYEHENSEKEEKELQNKGLRTTKDWTCEAQKTVKAYLSRQTAVD
jgi:hypothetical protein